MPLDWLKHAFAVEDSPACDPSPAQRALVERLCRVIIERRLVLPAQIFLESVRPLNFVTGQALRFFAPVLSALNDARATEELAEFLEQRGAIDYVCVRLDALSREVAGSPGTESTDVSHPAADGEPPPA